MPDGTMKILHQLTQLTYLHHEILKSILDEIDMSQPIEYKNVVPNIEWVPKAREELKSLDWIFNDETS